MPNAHLHGAQERQQPTQAKHNDQPVGKLTDVKFRLKVAAKTGGLCIYCGSALGEKYHLDHVVPKSKGGIATVSNMMPACQPCNMSKGNRDVEEWRVSRARAKLMAQRKIPYFSKEQRRYLESIGLDIYADIKLDTFWFEDAGLSLFPEAKEATVE